MTGLGPVTTGRRPRSMRLDEDLEAKDLAGLGISGREASISANFL